MQVSVLNFLLIATVSSLWLIGRVFLANRELDVWPVSYVKVGCLEFKILSASSCVGSCFDFSWITWIIKVLATLLYVTL